MDVACSSLPPKILTNGIPKPNEQTTVYLAARGCHFVGCCLYVLIVIIEIFPCSAQLTLKRRVFGIRQDQSSCQVLFEKNLHAEIVQGLRKRYGPPDAVKDIGLHYGAILIEPLLLNSGRGQVRVV